MKKSVPLIIAFILIHVLSIAQSGGQQSQSQQGWTKAFRDTAYNACVIAAAKSIGNDSARSYCSCATKKLEEMYPVQEEAGQLTAQDMRSPKLQAMIKGCLAMKWPEKDRNDFVSSCVASASKLGQEKATKYCNCMLLKVEAKYPNPNDSGQLTVEEMAKPEWQKALKECLE
jgi:hypothetical protein